MLQLLYAVIFMEMLMIMSFLFKTPLRNLVIISLNTVKRGQGPVVVKTVAAALMVMLCSAVYSIYKIRRRSLEGVAIVDPTDQVLLSNHVLQASLLGNQSFFQFNFFFGVHFSLSFLFLFWLQMQILTFLFFKKMWFWSHSKNQYFCLQFDFFLLFLHLVLHHI
jgi:hypothetical protein